MPVPSSAQSLFRREDRSPTVPRPICTTLNLPRAVGLLAPHRILSPSSVQYFSVAMLFKPNEWWRRRLALTNTNLLLVFRKYFVVHCKPRCGPSSLQYRFRASPRKAIALWGTTLTWATYFLWAPAFTLAVSPATNVAHRRKVSCESRVTLSCARGALSKAAPPKKQEIGQAAHLPQVGARLSRRRRHQAQSTVAWNVNQPRPSPSLLGHHPLPPRVCHRTRCLPGPKQASSHKPGGPTRGTTPLCFASLDCNFLKTQIRTRRELWGGGAWPRAVFVQKRNESTAWDTGGRELP